MNLEVSDKNVCVPPKYAVYDRGDAYVLIDVENGMWMRTNAAGLDIVELADGRRNIQAISRKLEDKHDMPRGSTTGFVEKFLAAGVRVGFVKYTDDEKNQNDIEEQHSPARLDLWMHVTGACNMRCPFCIADAGEGSSQTGMLLKEWAQLVDGLEGPRVRRFVLTGGEPTIWPSLLELIEHIRERWPSDNIKILSNGTAIAPKEYVDLARRVDAIQISVDGLTDETHDKLRGKGAFRKVKATLETLAAAGNEYWIAFTPTSVNLSELPRMPLFALQYKASGLHVNRLMPGGRAATVAREIVPDEKKLREAKRRLYKEYRAALGWSRPGRLTRRIKHTRPKLLLDVAGDYSRRVLRPSPECRCGLGTSLVSIDSSGNVYPCASLHQKEHNFGNVRNEPFWSIYDRMRQKMREWTVNDIDKCKECDVRMICAGGCRAHAYYATGTVDGEDPCCPKEVILDWMFKLSPSVERNAELPKLPR